MYRHQGMVLIFVIYLSFGIEGLSNFPYIFGDGFKRALLENWSLRSIKAKSKVNLKSSSLLGNSIIVHTENSLRRVRISQSLFEVEKTLKEILGEELVDTVSQNNPEDYQKALEILIGVSNFKDIMMALDISIDKAILRSSFQEAVLFFAQRVEEISGIPQFSETINLLVSKWRSAYLKGYFKVRDLFEESIQIYIPDSSLNIKPSLARKVLALQLALGNNEPIWSIWGWWLWTPEGIKKGAKEAPVFRGERKELILESLQKVDERQIYQLAGELAKVFGEEDIEFSSAIEMYQKIYDLLGSPIDGIPEKDLGTYPRNIIVTRAYYLTRTPSVEELKMLTELRFEVDLARLTRSKRWFVAMGTEGAALPIDKHIDPNIPDEQRIDVAMHSHPEHFPNRPSSFDLKAMSSETDLHFIIHKRSLTQYDKQGVVRFYNWEEVDESIYNP